MAVATVPKSEFRRDNSIQIGYGKVPSVDINGVTGWGLPGGEVTFRESVAYAFARKLDQEIRARLKTPEQLLAAS